MIRIHCKTGHLTMNFSSLSIYTCRHTTKYKFVVFILNYSLYIFFSFIKLQVNNIAEKKNLRVILKKSYFVYSVVRSIVGDGYLIRCFFVSTLDRLRTTNGSVKGKPSHQTAKIQKIHAPSVRTLQTHNFPYQYRK